MKIEIWSDVMCPFCYLGKHKLEKALTNFDHKNEVKIEWKSYLLNPDLDDNFESDTTSYLMEKRGLPKSEIEQVQKHLTEQAKSLGLTFNMDASKITSTKHAHRLLQWAKKNGKGNEMEERLFKAYFTEGLRVNDYEVLAQLAGEIGLNKEEALQILQKNEFVKEVENDLYEAQQFQIRGVPFFIFDRKYAISGAQDTQVFAQTLQKSYEEWKQKNTPSLESLGNGESCDVEGNCN